MMKLKLKVRESIKKGNLEELDDAVSEMIQSENISNYVDLLNDLLLVPFHYQHQYITRVIQDLKTPSSVPFISEVLESKSKDIP